MVFHPRAWWLSCLHDFAIYLFFRSCFALVCSALCLAVDLKLCQANQNFNLNFSIFVDFEQLFFDLNWRFFFGRSCPFFSFFLCSFCCGDHLIWDIFLGEKHNNTSFDYIRLIVERRCISAGNFFEFSLYEFCVSPQSLFECFVFSWTATELCMTNDSCHFRQEWKFLENHEKIPPNKILISSTD